jgi:hypothetical protein
MNLQNRIELLARLGEFCARPASEWEKVRAKASAENKWFIPEFIDRALENIRVRFLDPQLLSDWCAGYPIAAKSRPADIGIIMAGNIPLVGFHDWLCVFLSGHRQIMKLSAKDNVLLRYLVSRLLDWAPELSSEILFSDRLPDCDAYIATGSNNSASVFEHYFGRYPSIIRRNRTSVAILSGNETVEELSRLADDIQLYFGLGCRNVTKIFVPENYDFLPLLNALRKYSFFMEQSPYKNNFDYHLTIQIMNNRFYMSNDSIVLTENASIFSPIGQLHYSFYPDRNTLLESLAGSNEIQCIAGEEVALGSTQSPNLYDYADGVDTLRFLCGL